MRHRIIDNHDELREIIKKCQWCHLAMTDEQGDPYVIPMNFGFRDDVIYMHGAQSGKKISILKQHPQVCVNFSADHQLRYQSEQVACSWSMKYRSVLCYGSAEFIEDTEEKHAALDIIMAQYSDRQFQFNSPSLREVNCWKIRVEKFEGRVYGY
jgi:nitroimidazol reductase NimA-like FMN-containing flavoprotein (pyridoxamine 5'-phosphate oxidase superfamily)